MKILLVDDHPMIRKGCAALLSSAIQNLTVVECSSGEQALTLAASELPQLVILDISLPGISGIETSRKLQQRLPQLPILFHSMHQELSLVRQALDSGASGFLTKQCAPDLLIEAVRRVASGYLYIEPNLATRLAYYKPTANESDPRLESMTPREVEVFMMLANGNSNQKIAESLCISDKTVSNYLTLLKQKLQVKSHVELVYLAIDMGVVRFA